MKTVIKLRLIDPMMADTLRGNPDGPAVPTVHLEFPEHEAPELPDEGEITFRFRIARETEDKKARTCEYVLGLHEILDVKETIAPDEKKETREDQIDRLRKEIEDEAEDE